MILDTFVLVQFFFLEMKNDYPWFRDGVFQNQRFARINPWQKLRTSMLNGFFMLKHYAKAKAKAVKIKPTVFIYLIKV